MAALLAGSVLGLAPAAAAAGQPPEQQVAAPQDAPQDEVSVLAVSLTAGAAVAGVGSGVALSRTRRRGR